MNDSKKMRETLNKAIKAHNLNQIELAETLYKEILSINSLHPDANHNLSILYLDQNKIKDAKSYISKILDTKFPMKEYFITAAKIFYNDNQKNEAIEFLDHAVKLDPKDITPHFLKGVIYRDLGEVKNASKCIYEALKIDPDNPEINNSYGVLLGVLNKFEESIFYFNKAIGQKKEFIDPLANIALAYHKIQSYKNAEKFYLKIKNYYKDNEILKNKKNIIFKNYINYGAMLQELGDVKKAIQNYRMALEINNDDAEVYNNIGIALGEAGETLKASEYYRKSIKINKKYYAAFRHLCTTGLIDVNDPLFIEMEKSLETDINDNDKMLIAYGLGFIYDKIGSYKKAFKYTKFANQIVNKKITYTNDIEKILTTTPIEFNILNKKNIKLKNNYSPIFIVGMPRSGTTMIEKVLGNSDEVDEMGELVTMDRLITNKKIENINWPYNISKYSKKDLENIEQNYINIVREINPNVKNIFTDKMPSNFVHIGLLKLIFPNCKIINTERNPYDNCWSIFLLKFSEDFKYSFDLKNIANYYNDYKKLMLYWRSIFPNDIHHLIYENFINNPKEETKKLYEFCNLKYKKNAERFDLNEKIARTASNHDVKKKIHRKSVLRWKNYEKELSDLIDIIEDIEGA
tara:strand:- start:39 stop:1934 length:1896 start_codon:yes stop_codon:yes gene_type:complete